MYECPWLAEARKHLGQKEIPGRLNNPWIVGIWEYLKLPFRDDETPWCKGFVSYCLQKCGIDTPPGAAARSMQNWGVKIDKPIPGCIVVFWRGSPNSYSGHVGFVTGITRGGNIVVLGGNQNDQVSEATYIAKGQPGSRVVSYRWPLGSNVPSEALAPTHVTPTAVPPKKTWIKIPATNIKED